MLNRMNEEIKKAMMEKDNSRKEVLRAVKSTANLLAKEDHTEITDEHILAAIKKEMKSLKGTIDAISGKDGVEAAMEDAKYRMSVLEAYMPKMLTKEEVMNIAKPLIDALENPNMGSAMKAVMPVLKGKADGKVISSVVTELLK